jgi:hypothetical protein
MGEGVRLISPGYRTSQLAPDDMKSTSPIHIYGPLLLTLACLISSCANAPEYAARIHSSTLLLDRAEIVPTAVESFDEEGKSETPEG